MILDAMQSRSYFLLDKLDLNTVFSTAGLTDNVSHHAVVIKCGSVYFEREKVHGNMAEFSLILKEYRKRVG